MSLKLYTAICFFHRDSNLPPHKYRNISRLDKFQIFAKKQGYLYINIYDKITSKFIQRIWIEQ